MVRRWVGITLAGIALTGCAAHRAATRPHATVETNAPQPAWMQAATPAGLRALDTLDADFARTVHALPAPPPPARRRRARCSIRRRRNSPRNCRRGHITAG